jgi:uncharacterized damage-inducible protein DinB
MPTTLAALFEHNLWANRIVVEECAKMSDEQLDATMPGVYGSIRKTLVHIFGAEERYVGMLTNQPPLPLLRENEPFPGFDELRKLCATGGQGLVEISEQAKPDDMLRGTRRNGARYEIAGTVLLTQAINHATEHRSQINTMRTHLGLEPLDLDGWAYGDAHGQITMGEPPSPGANAS